jgi:hypothetical protein
MEKEVVPRSGFLEDVVNHQVGVLVYLLVSTKE